MTDYSYSVTPIDDEVLQLHNNAQVFNDADYYIRLAELYEEGHRLERNLKNTVKYYLKAVNIGSVKAAEGLAFFYEYGGGTRKRGNNYKKIAKWWLKAAELGSQEGMFRTGLNYQYGIGLDVNHSKAFQWYLKLAETKSHTGMFHVGECYFYGIGVEQNYTKAFDWYRKGADGNMQARKRLADCYALGIGTKQSLRKAYECGEYYTLDLQNTYCRYYA